MPPHAERMRTAIVVGLLLFALMLGGGGGGSPEPISEMLIEVIAAIAALLWIWLARSRAFLFDRWLWACVAIFALLPAIQLIPLPSAIWHALPGRIVEQRSLNLIGGNDGWRPITFDAPQTLASLLSLTPGIAIIFFISQLGLRSRNFILLVIGLFGLLSALVGAIQLASGEANWFRFYTFTHHGFATGFMANRNHQSDVMLIAIAALLSWAAANKSALHGQVGRLLIAIAVVVFVFSVILTGSRMGTALLVVAFGGSGWALWSLFRPGPRHFLSAALALAVVLSSGFLLARNNAALHQTWQRYEMQAEGRWDLWPDAVFAGETYWPVGAGLGNFVPVFKAAENLDAVDDTRPVRAHNDYLEFAIETGFAGLAIVAILLIALAVRIAARFRQASRRSAAKAQILFAATTIAIVALHSIVDYPLRTMAVGSLFALAVGMTANVRVESGERNG